MYAGCAADQLYLPLSSLMAAYSASCFFFFIAFATFSSHFCFSIQFPPSADLPPPYVLKTLHMEKPFTVPFRFHIFDSGEISFLGQDLSAALTADSLLRFIAIFFCLSVILPPPGSYGSVPLTIPLPSSEHHPSAAMPASRPHRGSRWIPGDG